MGVPALFRWLINRYPRLSDRAVEEKPRLVNGVVIPVDSAKANPNEMEFDCLYLDMNGIIHPCVHPEGKPAPDTEEEMFIEIFKYIDRLFAIVRPRTLLYMAIDGVAPRAKMNQQRSRRFRTARDAMEKQAALEEQIQAGQIPKPAVARPAFDTNAITPGTRFMRDLAMALRYYVVQRLNTDPGWSKIQVFLSDASVPGEGEHKIMDFIRRQRVSGSYNANLHHVLYGLDADLIMLALATHEPHFKLIREDVLFDLDKASSRCQLCGSANHQTRDCTGVGKTKSDEAASTPLARPFVFFHINRLREYLAYDMQPRDSASLQNYNPERAIDDWVFMCLFVGNDFLPHLPSLEIREGAIERLLEIYKRLFPKMDGYITDSGFINLNRVEMVLVALGEAEDQIFKERKEKEDAQKARAKRRSVDEKNRKNRELQQQNTRADANRAVTVGTNDSAVKPMKRSRDDDSTSKASKIAKSSSQPFTSKHEVTSTEPPVAMESEGASSSSSSTAIATTEAEPIADNGLVEKVIDDDEEEEEEEIDDVRLGENGWRDRYYATKFQIEASNQKEIQKIVKSYIEGVQWVMQYYYQGCASWKWYYPYHFAPFAFDFKGVSKLLVTFERETTPFKPFEQLMGVFPSASASLVPKPFRQLMKDETSPIIDFYPETFAIDMNGKKMAWQGVALLPFVDEERLLSAMNKVYPELDADDLQLNEQGEERLFVFNAHSLYNFVCDLYGKPSKDPVPIPPTLSLRIAGKIRADPEFAAYVAGSTYPSAIPEKLQDVEGNQAICAIYYQPDVIFPITAKLLRGANLPRSEITRDDLSNIGKGQQRGRGGHNGGYHSNAPSGNRGGGEYNVNYQPANHFPEPAAYQRNYNDRGSNGRNYGPPPYHPPPPPHYHHHHHPPVNFQDGGYRRDYADYPPPPRANISNFYQGPPPQPVYYQQRPPGHSNDNYYQGPRPLPSREPQREPRRDLREPYREPYRSPHY